MLALSTHGEAMKLMSRIRLSSETFRAVIHKPCVRYTVHIRPLSVLSWNVYGMEERCRDARTKEACKVIKSLSPHAVLLQELVPPMWARIKEHCDGFYHCFCSPGLFSGRRKLTACFQAILLRKPSGSLSEPGEWQACTPGELRSLALMRRDLLLLRAALPGRPLELLLMTAHLKAGRRRHAVEERRRELATVFREMTDMRERNVVCIFGGDLNIGAGEAKQAGLPPKVIDVWQYCGARKEVEYTWDPNTNSNIPQKWKARPFRFDRFYLSPLDGRVVPRHLSLVGKQPLVCCGRVVSDHWGVMVDFDINTQAHPIDSH